ncbi:MAG: LTA synthase family protein, partial [Candidatus Niameybacter stercoravium]|nr:LTA synthase family protein [Candidatus Niameybacter stercoravium]
VDNPNNNFAKPNIIMIMSESLFDLTNLSGISYSESPLAYFQNYGENYVSGSIATEVYGGRTCQTEYEVLTGHSVYFTEPQNIAYMQLVNEHTPSIPKLLQKEGYKTFAVHGYEKAFFSRDKAYKDLGIETFIASEDFIDPTLARGYVSDETLVDKVIELYEDNQNEPLFCHVVTMQNHMPYTDTYTANGIRIEGDNLTEEEKSRLTTYANGVKDSDKALHKLIAYFEQVEEPTIIVMYGDHLPALDENYALYEKLHYIEGNFDEADCYKLYQTPFIMWNNYNLPAKSMGVIDASYLGSQMLHYIGYDKDPYMNYLVETKNHLKAYGQNFQIDQEGKLKSLEALSELEQSVLNNLWMIQYNRLALD